MITVIASIKELEVGKVYDQNSYGGAVLWDENRNEVHEFRMQVLAKATREEWEAYIRGNNPNDAEEAIRDSDITIRKVYGVVKNDSFWKVSFD